MKLTLKPLAPKESAESINDYLIDLTKEYTKISDEFLLSGKDLDLLSISRAALVKKLEEIDINKFSGPHPLKKIKHFAEQLSGPLTSIFNSSFQEKCFHGAIWKAY